MAFDVSKGRDRSASHVHICGSTSQQTQKGVFWQHLVKGSSPFLQFVSSTKVKDFCLVRSAYLCYRQH